MIRLYPPPASLRTSGGEFDLTARNHVCVTSRVDDRTRRAIARFAQARNLAVRYGATTTEQPLLTITRARGTEPEAYTLVCNTQGATLEAATGEAVFRGLTTFGQLLDQFETSIPGCRITDRPDFAARGVMLDLSRCKVPSMETLRQLIDDLATLKYNQLQLYIEHTFAFSRHPLVWADASPITAAEMTELQAWCRDRYIELVPNLNSFGHFERWLRHPEYHAYAECPHGFTHPFSGTHVEFGSTLRPNRQSLLLLTELYDEYLPLFDSRQFNVGGDEPWELGHGASKKICAQRGTTAVYVDFMSKIQKLVEARDRTMMFWSDIVLREPACLDSLSQRLTALNWGYEGNHPFRKECAHMADAGIPFYVCPGTSSWNALTGRSANVQANLANAARSGIASGAVGYLVTDWGDGGHHQYLPTSYQGFMLGGCHAWNHRGSRNLDVGDGVSRVFFSESGAGELLVRLGRALELAPSKIRNATVFNRLLFWSMQHEPGAAGDITAAQLADCDDELAAIRAALYEVRGRDAALVRAELENATDLARHGVHRLQLFRGYREDKAAMRTELAVAIGRHETLWLARNRPGGLHESSARLRQSLAALTAAGKG